MCQVVKKEFKIIAEKHTGLYKDYAELIPKAAHQFLQRASNLAGTEVAVYEPKASESHTEGTFYVGVLASEADTLPEGAEFLDIQHTYGMIRGKGTEMGSLYSTLDQWIDEQGYSRDTLENFILETYHPAENDVEEVEIYIPIKA
ncbi:MULTISPECIES: GyrI-like domain-containing protein [unclassified Bacillus (in: firmicutes)]|uniref:GyrI-like domain-containing protein n=1 Tax=unclassified Bacillus (in: firmicutes) TaxID=185979 RepID=UPI001BEA75D0|nr:MULTISPECIES: GyrI-like domain-containing protein [unclassified Bacillus (in: firmicutes)]MBT2636882.1 GyrI-like domain-containing protein [Bacillus sp. ISL-39]MBT2659970.1 GyrI-like domain-containing protein [Bacillus sp. ISL-45]